MIDAAVAWLTRQAGVDYAEARRVATESELVRVRDGELRQAAHGLSAGIGIRVLASGAWGFASAAGGAADPVCAEATAIRCAQAALDAARAAAAVTPEKVRLAEEAPQRGQY